MQEIESQTESIVRIADGGACGGHRGSVSPRDLGIRTMQPGKVNGFDGTVFGDGGVYPLARIKCRQRPSSLRKSGSSPAHEVVLGIGKRTSQRGPATRIGVGHSHERGLIDQQAVSHPYSIVPECHGSHGTLPFHEEMGGIAVEALSPLVEGRFSPVFGRSKA